VDSVTDQAESELRGEVELIASVMESMPSGADAAAYFREDSVLLERALSRAAQRAFEKGTAQGRLEGEAQGRREALDEAELMRKARVSWAVILVGTVLAAILWTLVVGGSLR
jgi:hypothetical protein